MTEYKFTPAELQAAVRTLFELNNYEVRGPQQVHGAEVDLVAQTKGDPFAVPVYIEVTIEYVDNEKYGKDLTKLAMIRQLDPNAQLLIVSSVGFSAPVVERATQTRVQTLTYEELFGKFERFEYYVRTLLADNGPGRDLAALSAVYEEPFFDDSLGKHPATQFLAEWRRSADPKQRWLVILGEYGTGKTALTRILQYRWLREYAANPATPIPFRIELRDFTRQFDARGLIHHFLDRNQLGHLSIDFVMTLIRSGRIVLLLDGYDEMAQYLHVRERRTCLEALAQLAADGARGILTSRPNYFTEGEELQVFEILYASLRDGRYLLGQSEFALLDQEKRVDQLLEKFLDRYERTLRDLTPDQTKALVERALSGDVEGRDVILRILNRVFRDQDDGAAVALSGKPVIITFLLEVVEALKEETGDDRDNVGQLTEWQVYRRIVDLLMLRDLKRTGLIGPEDRRRFLHALALMLSEKDRPVLLEEDFKELIARTFVAHLRRMGTDGRRDEMERLFADLRSSATLTRGDARGRDGWRFSHNSLREFLVAEYMVGCLELGTLPNEALHISDAMRVLAGSMSRTELERLIEKLSAAWVQRASAPGAGRLLCLLWDGARRLFAGDQQPSVAALKRIAGASPALNHVTLSRMGFSSLQQSANLEGLNCSGSELYDVDFTGAKLSRADFASAILENVRFCGCDLTDADMSRSFWVDVDLSDAVLGGTDFSGVDVDAISIVLSDSSLSVARRRLDGQDALGYIQFHGGHTKEIPRQAVLQFHPKYEIVEKVLGKLAEQSQHQRRGVEQRGASAKDVPFARQLVERLLNKGYLEVPKARKDIVESTDEGRGAFKRFVETKVLPEPALKLLEEWTW